MPTPFDLLSEKLDDQTDPDDQLRLMLGQDQGANLAGGPDGQPNAMTPPALGGVGPSPNVPGPLAALAPKFKPRIKLKTRGQKPHIKLKPGAKPRLKLSLAGGV